MPRRLDSGIRHQQNDEIDPIRLTDIGVGQCEHSGRMVGQPKVAQSSNPSRHGFVLTGNPEVIPPKLSVAWSGTP